MSQARGILVQIMIITGKYDTTFTCNRRDIWYRSCIALAAASAKMAISFLLESQCDEIVSEFNQLAPLMLPIIMQIYLMEIWHETLLRALMLITARLIYWSIMQVSSMLIRLKISRTSMG